MLTFKSLRLRVSIVAAKFGFNWLVAMEPNKILPFVVGEATGEVALLDGSVIEDASRELDGPGCGLGNDELDAHLGGETPSGTSGSAS